MIVCSYHLVQHCSSRILPILALACLVAMASQLPGGEGTAGEWPAKEQADLRSLHGHASALKVEALCEPVNSVMSGDHILVPNPDGKTYDLLKFYWKRYGGPNTIVSMDWAPAK